MPVKALPTFFLRHELFNRGRGYQMTSSAHMRASPSIDPRTQQPSTRRRKQPSALFRCLLIGQNGAGKSTLLRVLAGRHLTKPDDAVVVLDK